MQCNICGSTVFEAGPTNRLSPSGKLPQCAECKSLERHRAIRSYFDRIDHKWLKTLRALILSYDLTMKDEWFASCEKSYFGKFNSIDVTAIDRPDGAYDFIFLSHVLDVVEDDIRAFGELARVLSFDGILVICAGWPFLRKQTVARLPDNNPHKIFQNYGEDRHERLKAAWYGLSAIEVDTTDPVTGDREMFDLYVRSSEVRDLLLTLGTFEAVSRTVFRLSFSSD